jgi:tRNA pseudouridine55 synthase
MNSQKASPLFKHGFIPVYKPLNISSFSVVKKVRYIAQVKKVGHAGTLDPFAEGLLLIAIGRNATKNISHFVDLEKEYEFTISFGNETDTLDTEGDIIKTMPVPENLFDKLPSILDSFIGTYDQMPPQFSAKKINGKRAYALAREGKHADLKPSKITIKTLTLLEQSKEKNTCTLRVSCSKGTYVRSLAKDIATALGTAGYVIWLKRTAIGHYSSNQALDLDTISLESIEAALFNVTDD